MVESPAILEIEGISKRYRIGRSREPYLSLRDTLARGVKSLWNTVRRGGGTAGRAVDFWALQDVSLTVAPGETVGVIGRNGAGKSTLLKILSRVTPPTRGNIVSRGRIASLLEVGTGFHPELTGRENIYLNGTILGMTRSEVRKRYDAIAAFSEIEEFLETPVKRYSSGMYVRLAFSVAAHLESEILLVDEVLAVGDAAFQRKCLEKMSNIHHEGRTVLFVSHNMTMISRLCERAVWLESGRVHEIGAANRVVQSYLASARSSSEGSVQFEPRENAEAYLCEIELKSGAGTVTGDFDVLSPIIVGIAFQCRRPLFQLRIGVRVTRSDGVVVFTTTSQDYDSIPGRFEAGRHRVELQIPGCFLAAGDYTLSVNVCEPNVQNHDLREDVMGFRITGNPFRLPRNLGLLVCPFSWRLVK